ncbi:MAG: LuxR C-terminal-related transcriptional regulator [Thermomicrobiales bacterium]
MRLMWWTQAAGLLALTHQALERPADARQEVEDAKAFLLERHAMRLLPHIGAFQAELDRRQGRLAEAVAWARHVEPVPLTWALSCVEPRVAQVRALLADEAASAWDQAALLLAELREFCARMPNRRLSLEVEVLTALLADRRGEGDAALSALLHAVQAAEPDGWLRLFVDQGDAMEHLLQQLGAKGTAPLAVKRILATFPLHPAGRPELGQAHLPDPLSDRELEILALLSARESNKEIAARLYIAPATVKRHTLHIYRKLDVNDRRQAVARATELGLLPALQITA